MHRAGTWFRCFHLARALARQGHDVALVKISPDNRLAFRRSDVEGVRLIETPRFFGARLSHHNTRLPSDLVARTALVLRERYDVVHTYSHHFNAMLPGLLARRLLRCRTLVADWDDLWTEGGLYGTRPKRGVMARVNYAVDNWSERNLKLYADGVTVVSRDLFGRSIEHGVPRDRILLLPNGAQVDTIHPGNKVELRKALDLPPNEQVLVFSGFGRYDLEFVVSSLRMLSEQGMRPLTIVTGPHEEESRRLFANANLTSQVRVTGIVPFEDLIRYLGAADVGLMPYADKPLNRARWPIKVGDYLAAGLPVATCDVGEMGALVRDWGVGTASPPDPRSFAEAIRGLLEMPDLASMARKARECAEAISWDMLGERLEAFYLGLKSPPRLS